MKLLVAFAFLAFICLARSAPAPPTTARVLVFQEYNADEEHHEDIPDIVVDNDEEDAIKGDDDDDDEITTPTTTTSTTTRRSTYLFPTNNRRPVPTRRPYVPSRTSSIQTTTEITEDDPSVPDYDGDFKYIKNFRKYFKQLLEDIKRLVKGLTGVDFFGGNSRDTPLPPTYNRNRYN